MSSNKGISTSTVTDDDHSNGCTTGKTNLSVKLQASKFQAINNKDSDKIASLMTKYEKQTASTTNTHRSLGKQTKNSTLNNDDAIFITGSKNLKQDLCNPMMTGDKQFQRINNHRLLKTDKETIPKIEDRSNHYDGNLNSSTTDDDADDDEDMRYPIDCVRHKNSTGNNSSHYTANNSNDRPKPGRLDLTQFDNITSAIAKLKIQPQLSNRPDKTADKTSSRFSPWKLTKEQTNIQKLSEEEKKGSDDRNTALTSNSRRQLQISRKNHGRPVAPPRLPASTPLASSAPNASTIEKPSAFIINPNLDSAINQFDQTDRRDLKISKNRSDALELNRKLQKGTWNDESSVDLSQSPLGQRLLRYSRGLKVSELGSYGSDIDLPTSPLKAKMHLASQPDVILGSTAMSSSSSRINSYHRTHSAEPKGLVLKRDETIRQLNEILAKPPPNGRSHNDNLLRETNKIEEQHLGNIEGGLSSSHSKKSEKESKKDKKRDEKLEKRKLKEEKLRKQEEEKQKRQDRKLASRRTKSNGDNFVGDDGIPLFIRRCIEFIEAEGLDAEGIYRVPGNRAHVDTFMQKFKDNPQMSIVESDIPVNAVATALKDFLSKKISPIIPANLMDELTELSNIADKELRASEVRNLVKRLPATNYNILRYVFSHFVKVSLNSALNSMDSKNLAICWWPTLLPLQFNDMVMFEHMRPHLEESVQTLIDRYNYIFDSEENVAYH